MDDLARLEKILEAVTRAGEILHAALESTADLQSEVISREEVYPEQVNTLGFMLGRISGSLALLDMSDLTMEEVEITDDSGDMPS